VKAAIYARRSTDESDRHEENKSVARQVDRARAYAASKGWLVSDEHIYIDDGISGAEFRNRPDLLRLLNHLHSIDVIVMSELSRLGREMSHTSTVLAQIRAAGVHVWFYLTDDELRFESASDKFMVSALAFAAELEREKASQRSRDALLRKAERGFNTGGRVYGYDNVPVYAAASNGSEVKLHTDYRVNDAEAEVIRTIFRMYAAGHGMKTIAHTLNRDLACSDLSAQYFAGRSPPSPWKRSGSWAPSCGW
jgi:site-specific DNA recombinase